MNITDITPIFDAAIRLGCAIIVAIIIPWIRTMKNNDKVVTAMKVTDEVAKVAKIVVSAANELYITKEIEDKAKYAFEQAKKELNSRGIIVDDEQIINQIKAAVTELRVEIANTPAEKK